MKLNHASVRLTTSKSSGPRPWVKKTLSFGKSARVQILGEPVLEPKPAPESRWQGPVERKEWMPYDGNTAFNLYLREVGQTDLLTPAEELKLAARVKKGDKKAREQMIKANLRLVVKIARTYEDYGMPLLDLINEGNIGLIKAVERFNPKKGAKLSTYSSWWIKQGIKRALANQSKTIRLPVHVVDKLFRLRQASVKLHEVLGREPSDEELGEELGYDAARVARLRVASLRPASLDAPLGDDEEGSRVADVVRDEKAETPYEQLEGKNSSNMLRGLLDKLDPREADILKHRFGLDGDPEKTLDEVGLRLGLTRERIRQIQENALKKLRRQIERLESIRVAA
jgi:RNA polymerase primary sigma factor